MKIFNLLNFVVVWGFITINLLQLRHLEFLGIMEIPMTHLLLFICALLPVATLILGVKFPAHHLKVAMFTVIIEGVILAFTTCNILYPDSRLLAEIDLIASGETTPRPDSPENKTISPPNTDHKTRQ
ncbi:MAG: hypothetical protein RR060_03970 [Victivallaceae bacterium]